MSFRDGTAHKENQLFNSEPNTLQICLYHDDFNIVNPLGNKIQKDKISAFYFVTGNFANKYKSRLKDIHLCILSPAFFVNKYGYEKILRPLLDDLLKLETEGIKISFEGVDNKFCGSSSMVIADNLAAHALGGFFCNFLTAQRFCRFCNCRKNQINKNLRIENFILRTKEGYENNLQSIELDPNYSSLYGIKSDSYLHSLNFFHVTIGLPPDLAHDLFEGFGVDLVTNIIVHFVMAQYFNLEELNGIIQTFSYSTIDKTKKPKILKITSLNSFKVKVTACEMWNFLRLLLLIIGSLVPETDEKWYVFLNFLQILERLCAPKFEKPQLKVLGNLIHLFFVEYLKQSPDENLKPKAHFLQQYPQMIERFGPLVKH